MFWTKMSEKKSLVWNQNMISLRMKTFERESGFMTERKRKVLW